MGVRGGPIADMGVLGTVLVVETGVLIKLDVVLADLSGVLVFGGGAGEVNTEWIFESEWSFDVDLVVSFNYNTHAVTYHEKTISRSAMQCLNSYGVWYKFEIDVKLQVWMKR